MRKKGIRMAGIVTCLCLAVGCAGQGNVPDVADAGAVETQAQSAAQGQQGVADTAVNADTEEDKSPAASNGDADDREVNVDIDLTQMSSTMVYSEVYNMMTEPERYVGETVNMEGVFSAYYDLQTERYYYACIIQDATACCAQGIEFVLDGEHQFPDDYPEQGSTITVRGTFDIYEEDGDEYCQLLGAVLTQ